MKLNCEYPKYHFKHENELLEEIDRNEFFNEIDEIDQMELEKSLNVKKGEF